MSARALQRVVVRMLYDEPFLNRVYDDAEAATADCDLTGEERDWLCAPDARAWRVDPLRRSRSLAALVEEFAVSVALFVRTTPDGTARLDAFFSSENFHRGMQKGESLAQIFAGWFSNQTIYRDVVELEASVARVRRTRDAGTQVTVEPGSVALAPAVESRVVAGGTAASFASALGILRQGPLAERALDRNLDLPLPSPGDPEGILVDGRSDDPKLEMLSADLAAVLAIASQPIRKRDFVTEAAHYGADEEDCEGILASFAEDGLVVQA